MSIKRKPKSSEESKKRSVRKTSGKQQKKMTRTKYGPASLKHAKKGIGACCYAAAVLLIFGAMIAFSYREEGNVHVFIGFAGLGCVVLSWLGIISAIRGFRERNKNYITCKIGVVSNALLFLGLISIFLRGLF